APMALLKRLRAIHLLVACEEAPGLWGGPYPFVESVEGGAERFLYDRGERFEPVTRPGVETHELHACVNCVCLSVFHVSGSSDTVRLGCVTRPLPAVECAGGHCPPNTPRPRWRTS